MVNNNRWLKVIKVKSEAIAFLKMGPGEKAEWRNGGIAE